MIVVETSRSPLRPSTENDRLRHEVRRRAVAVAGVQPDDVRCVPKGTLPFTPSGKLQRHRVVRILAGQASADVLAGATGGGS